jgi:hypothetical protein
LPVKQNETCGAASTSYQPKAGAEPKTVVSVKSLGS